MINIARVLKDGQSVQILAHAAKEKDKLGILRAGNSGIMSEDGDSAGKCPRVAHLRTLGIDPGDIDSSTRTMFQLGIANEDIVHQDLKLGLPEGFSLKREEEIPIAWKTKNGTAVTGRPDMVIFNPAGDAVLGLELKSVASVWTSCEILGNRQPKLDHLIQAGHYALKLGIPFDMVYKQYAIQEIPGWSDPSGKKPGWARKKFPKEGAWGSEYIEYEKGRVRPFEVVYSLKWDNGVLKYRHIPSDGEPGLWQMTVVREEDLLRFFEETSKMGPGQPLPPAPTAVDVFGKEKNYSFCNYCSLKDICKKKSDYTTWLKDVRALRSASVAAN